MENPKVTMIRQADVFKLLFDTRNRFEESPSEEDAENEILLEKDEVIDLLDSLIHKVQKIKTVYMDRTKL